MYRDDAGGHGSCSAKRPASRAAASGASSGSGVTVPQLAWGVRAAAALLVHMAVSAAAASGHEARRHEAATAGASGVAGVAGAAAADPQAWPLFDGTAPGDIAGFFGPETTQLWPAGRVIRNVSRPSLTPFLVNASHPLNVGSAVVVAPGGA